GLAGTYAGPTTFNIPTPISTKLVGGMPQPQTSFSALPPAERQIWIYNGTITGLSYVHNGDPPPNPNYGDLNASQSATRMTISFTANTATDPIVISWGGHIASSVDWGAGEAAGGINGSPYHTRLIDLDGSGG